MTIVYLDLLILVNFAANYMLLALTARMSGSTMKKSWLALSACFGAIYAALCIMEFRCLEHSVCRIGVGVLMCAIAFGKKKDFLRTVLIYYGTAATLGGAVWALELLGDRKLTLENGILYSWIDVRLLIFLFAICFVVLDLVGNRIFYHKKTELVSTTLTARGKTVRLTALIDTGNTLTDPVSNQPVLVVEGEACLPLLPMRLSLDRPIEAMEQLNMAGEHGFRLIPYCTVGIRNGLMLAMQVECKFGEKGKRKTLLAALSPTKVSDGGAYQALIGGKEWI